MLDLLTSLVEKSLVVYEQETGEGRYRLLETVRQYARDRLMESGEAERLRAAHQSFFLAFAEEAIGHYSGPEQAAWFDRLEADHGNLRAALEWCGECEHGAESVCLRLVAALARFWVARGLFRQGREWIEAALSRKGAEGRTVARCGAS